MAKEKFNPGDTIRLKKNISFGTIHIRANTMGVIMRINTKFLGDTEYEVKWGGNSTTFTMKGSKSFALAQAMDGSVFKS